MVREPGASRTRESIAVDFWFEGDLAPTGELMGGSVCGDLYKGSVILIAKGADKRCFVAAHGKAPQYQSLKAASAQM